jgi:hypothetical protein
MPQKMNGIVQLMTRGEIVPWCSPWKMQAELSHLTIPKHLLHCLLIDLTEVQSISEFLPFRIYKIFILFVPIKLFTAMIVHQRSPQTAGP